MEENLTFISSYGPRFDLPQVVDEIVRFMQAEPMRRYKVTIGTDSELLSGGRADFGLDYTAIQRTFCFTL